MMTTHFLGCQLTVRDFQICQTLLDTLAGPDSPSARLLRSKLDTATIVSDGDVDPLVVTLNSRVEFQVDDEAPQMRILVKCEFRNGLVGMTHPISTPRGIALLGLREGQACSFDEGGRMRRFSCAASPISPSRRARVAAHRAATRTLHFTQARSSTSCGCAKNGSRAPHAILPK